jgi:hypothetical protein
VSEQDPPRLDYAPPSPWHRRRSSRQVALLCFLLIAGTVCFRWGRVAVNQVQANFAFQRCIKYLAAPNAIAYESDSGRIKSVSPDAWEEFSLRWSGAASMTLGTLFLHERSTLGKRRLVAVDLLGGDGPTIQIQASVFAPPVALAPARRKSATVRTIPLPPHPPLRIFQGQIDPTDPTHFTIRYETENTSGLLDGWLRDDDTAVIEPRETPATLPVGVTPDVITSPPRA